MTWTEFLQKRSRKPRVSFVHGMRVAVEKGVCCEVHSHPTLEIVYHASGSGMARMAGGRLIPFQPGSVVIHAPGEPHDQVMDEDAHDFCVHVALAGKSVPRMSLYVPPLTSPALVEDIRLLSQRPPRADAVEQAILDLRAAATLLSLVRLACANRDEEEGPHTVERHVLKAEQYLNAHFATIGALGEVAEQAGLSHDHLRHCFRKVRGKSMVRYLNELRIDRARTLLIHSRLPLKQISGMCGFKDEYYFSTVFRNFTNTTPGRFRGRNG